MPMPTSGASRSARASAIEVNPPDLAIVTLLFYGGIGKENE
jgi:hypothetical protein